jgi:hypothetical protein
MHEFPIEIERDQKTMIDIILGYGQSVVNNSFTCPGWMVDSLILQWVAHGWARHDVYCGKPGGKFSGRSVNHLPQLFRKPFPDYNVHSLQLFISKRYLQDNGTASFGGFILHEVIDKVIKEKSENVAHRMYV